MTDVKNCLSEEFRPEAAFGRILSILSNKTRFIRALEEADTLFPLIVRPRRFGKSLFANMLMAYYDKAAAAISNVILPGHGLLNIRRLMPAGIWSCNSISQELAEHRRASQPTS